MKKHKGGRPAKTPAPEVVVSTLKDIGVSEKQSQFWQKLAEIPQEEFDAALADTTRMPTTNGIIREKLQHPPAKPVSKDALWLWGRLRDFREFVLDKEPADVMETMTTDVGRNPRDSCPRSRRG